MREGNVRAYHGSSATERPISGDWKVARLHITLGVAIILSGADACTASARATTDGRGGVAFESGRANAHSRDVLTARELLSYPTLRRGTVYEVIAGLRPEYLTPLRVDSHGTVVSTPLVIVNGNPRGGLDALRAIGASTVAEVRLVRPTDALVRYGPEYRSGAIVVRTTTP